MKKLALGSMAIGHQSTPDAFREALNTNGVIEMDDAQVRAAFAEGKLHHQSSIDALRRVGRDALAAELEAAYAPPVPASPAPVEEDSSEDIAESGSADEDSAEESAVEDQVDNSEDSGDLEAADSDFESSGSDSSEDEEESSSPDEDSSSDSNEGGIARATGGGWYELDPPFEGADKVQGKGNVPDGYAIIED